MTYPAIHMTPAFYRRFAGVTPNFPALAFKVSRDADLSAFLGRVESTAIVNPQATSRIEFISSVDNAKTIERTTHVQAIALWVLALLTALTTLLILFQTIARQVMLESFDYQTLEALGFSRGQLTGVAMLRWGVTAGSGAALALCLAIGMSWFAPIGIARVVEPASGIAVDAVPLLLGAAVLVVVVLAIALLHTSRVVRVSRSGQRHTAARRSRVAAALAQAGRAPAQVIGVRMALETGEGHSAVPVRSTLAGAIVGIASIVAALTFTTSINHLLDTPRLRGVSWDAVIGDAFDPGDANQVLPVVRHTRAVDQISAGGAGTLTIGGRSITAVGMDRITGNIQPVLLAGHVPLRDDEIVLANRTLRDLHTHIGGVVTASSGSRSARMLVVGTAVAPTLPTEAFNSRGAFLTFNGLRTLLPSNAEDIFLFRVRHHAQLSSVIATIHRSLPGVAIRRPSTSGDIDEIAHVRDLPLVLAGVLALLSAATLAHLIVTAVRTRRTQFAILKAIGFVGRQVQAAVAWQATTTVVVALCIAIPAGYVLGRLGWSVLADQIGFVSDPALRLWYPLAVAIGAIVTANAVGAIPSCSAARTQPAATLRAE